MSPKAPSIKRFVFYARALAEDIMIALLRPLPHSKYLAYVPPTCALRSEPLTYELIFYILIPGSPTIPTYYSIFSVAGMHVAVLISQILSQIRTWKFNGTNVFPRRID